MITLQSAGVRWQNGAPVPAPVASPADREKTMAYQIFRRHNQKEEAGQLHLKFDSLISHDITYVGIIQTAKASGLTEFPVPYVMTNCHNSLCAVGGTINEDDHVFGLSAAIKYGGNFVPANQAVIHQYAREMMSGCGRMILGSDSHTRYGAIGTMGVGEGGPEIVKQLLKNTYDIAAPEVVMVYLTGEPAQGVGPHDVAIALCGEVYKNGFVKNKVLEFVGPGIKNLPMDYRIGIDVMTTETACLSSIWETDGAVEEYLAIHGRPEAYESLHPQEGAYYDSLITIDLSKVEPMAALPFHPAEAYPIRELMANPGDIFREVEKRTAEQFGGKVTLSLTDKLVDGKIVVDQGIIAGCAGGMYDNIAEAAAILDGHDVGSGYFSLSIYPPSVPVNLELIHNGVQQSLLEAGALFKPCFCGPCFGAGDVPANGGFSIRHSTRNFPNREGSKPGNGQISAVALMDARSIAATAANGGRLTPATELDWDKLAVDTTYTFDAGIYQRRVYNGFGKADAAAELKRGPNIADWPSMSPLPENLVLPLASVITDPVTTTDELIPSGETSSLRSNPLKLSEFTLSRKDPAYVGRAKDVQAMEKARLADPADAALLAKLEGMLAPLKAAQPEVYAAVLGAGLKDTGIGSTIFALKPGDGSAREQAASCQKVLGGWANVAAEYATKRYRSNLINWGMLPLLADAALAQKLSVGDCFVLPGIRTAVEQDAAGITGWLVSAAGAVEAVELRLGDLTADERQIILDGCLINFYNHN